MNDDANMHQGSDDKQRETRAFMEVLGVNLGDKPTVSSPFQQVLDLEKERAEGNITDAECSEAVKNVVSGTLGSLPLR